MPSGRPTADNVTSPLKPFSTPTVIVVEQSAPRSRVKLLGEAKRLKPGGVEAVATVCDEIILRGSQPPFSKIQLRQQTNLRQRLLGLTKKERFLLGGLLVVRLETSSIVPPEPGIRNYAF